MKNTSQRRGADGEPSLGWNDEDDQPKGTIRSSMSLLHVELKNQMQIFLKKNINVFAWTQIYMPGIDPKHLGQQVECPSYKVKLV